MDEQTTKRDLIRVCHLMYERSYVVSSDGNVSVRLDDDRILATPTMTCKGRMTEDLIAITHHDGTAIGIHQFAALMLNVWVFGASMVAQVALLFPTRPGGSSRPSS